jgi:hypothetical protein
MVSGLPCVLGLALVAIASGQTFKTDSCELENGFKFEECGTVNSQKVCCSPEQQCVSAQPFEGDEQFTCSADRSLTGNKVVKIVLIPVFLTITFLGFASYLAIQFKKDCKMRPVLGLCIMQMIMSVFLLFSPLWVLGFYTVILNFLVANGVKSKGLAWWTYRLLFVLQFFHIIAIFGPFETFHVPFGGLSTYASTPTQATSNLEHMAGALSADEAVCSAYYGKYFDLLSIELTKEDVNPNQKTFGYCVKGWLTFVHFMCVVVGLIQCFTVFLTGQLLLNSSSSAEKAADATANALTEEKSADAII